MNGTQNTKTSTKNAVPPSSCQRDTKCPEIRTWQVKTLPFIFKIHWTQHIRQQVPTAKSQTLCPPPAWKCYCIMDEVQHPASPQPNTPPAAHLLLPTQTQHFTHHTHNSGTYVSLEYLLTLLRLYWRFYIILWGRLMYVGLESETHKSIYPVINISFAKSEAEWRLSRISETLLNPVHGSVHGGELLLAFLLSLESLQ